MVRVRHLILRTEDYSMRNTVVALLAAALIFVAIKATAQTVYTKQDENLQTTGGLKLTSVPCTIGAASRWTGWILVSTMRSIALDVDFVDASASAASLDMRCETSRVNTTPYDSGRDLGVLVSTVNGVTTSVPSSWSQKNAALGPPGTSGWTWSVTNIPAPWINCLFTCGAGGAADDNITVFVRGIVP